MVGRIPAEALCPAAETTIALPGLACGINASGDITGEMSGSSPKRRNTKNTLRNLEAGGLQVWLSSR